jgi:hypothetical protein
MRAPTQCRIVRLENANCELPETLGGSLTTQSILWRNIHLPGHEACRLSLQGAEWHLEGTAVFSHLHQPCRLSYLVVCEENWNTAGARISGWVADTAVDIDLVVDREHRWRLNGIEQPTVTGCFDVDLNFSPSTNLLPIRRLNLAVGQGALVKAAWLKFPSFELEPLSQVYSRIDESTYRYESGGGQFTADLKVDRVGFVRDYPAIWQTEE